MILKISTAWLKLKYDRIRLLVAIAGISFAVVLMFMQFRGRNGLIVGIVVVYQILYTNVSEHLAEYATLKAMGYRHNYLLSVIFQESVILAVLAYIPGFLVAALLYKLARDATLLPIAMRLTRSLFVLFLTFCMSLIAGTIAVKKLRDADPADIF